MTSTTSPLINTLFNAQQQIIRYVHPTVLVLGLTCSFLNIGLFFRRKFLHASYCTYLLVGNIAWIIALPWRIGFNLYTLNHENPILTKLVWCKLHFYVIECVAMTFRWCLVASCFDRYALSSTNARLRSYATVRVARRFVITIAFIWLLLPAHILIFFDLEDGVCGISHSTIAAYYHSCFTILFGGILPPLFMIIFSLLIHRNISAKEKRCQKLIRSKCSENKNGAWRTNNQKFVCILFAQVFVYIVVTMPSMGFYFYNAATVKSLNKSPETRIIERFYSLITESILLSYSFLSFSLHTLVSQTFRQELVKMLMYLFRSKKSTGNTQLELTTKHSRFRRSPHSCIIDSLHH